MLLTRKLTTATLCGVLALGNAYASEGDDDLSLGDLMNLTITVASKRAEKISDAPSAVTAYSAAQIQKYGYYTLKELGDITSGYSSVTDQNDWYFETRGLRGKAKHLLMVDGIPINNTRGYTPQVYNDLPLLFASKVSFLRGPASALYGTSAFNGVISVDSKVLEEEGTSVDNYASVGSLGMMEENKAGQTVTYKRLFTNVNHKGESFMHQAAFGYATDVSRMEDTRYNADGTDGTNSWSQFDVFGPGGPIHDNEESIFLKANSKVIDGLFEGVTLGMLYTEKRNGYGQAWGTYGGPFGVYSSPMNRHTWESYIGYLKYEKELAEGFKLNGYYKYNRSKEAGEQYNEACWWAGCGTYGSWDYYIPVVSHEGLLEIQYDVSEDGNLIAGVNVDHRYNDSLYTRGVASGGDFDGADSNQLVNAHNNVVRWAKMKTTVYSGYAQFQQRLDFLAGTILTLGFRDDYGTNDFASYNQFSPRVAVVQKLTEEMNVKASVGSALKVPGSQELGHNDEKGAEIAAFEAAQNTRIAETNSGEGTVSVLTDLEPEVATTYEGGITYNSGNISIDLIGFYNNIKQPLERVNAFDNQGTWTHTYVNSNGDTVTTGALATDYFQNLGTEVFSTGFEFNLKYAVSKDLIFINNVSWATSWDDAAGDAQITPDLKVNTGVEVGIVDGLTLALWTKYVNGYYKGAGFGDEVDSDNSSFAIDLNTRYSFNENATVGLKVVNVLDAEYLIPAGHATNVFWYQQQRTFHLFGELNF